MAVSEAHTRASVKYNKSRDNIMLRPDKATGAAIRAAAERAGIPLQRFIIDCVLSCIGSATAPAAPAAPAASPEE